MAGSATQRFGFPKAFLFAAISAVLTVSCTVPEHMQVRAGIDPRNVDDDVRFRTTYYFRVFDSCRGAGGSDHQDQVVPETDSLYRFRMTGKANALFTEVHFEAGSLKSYEIDPFGAAVVFDSKNGRFHFKSRRQTEQEANQADAEAELDRLIEIRQKLAGTLGKDNDAVGKADLLIAQQLDIIGQRHLPDGKTSDDAGPGSDLNGDESGLCPSGSAARRGFQILGPEGWKTFDQDERLLLAMSTSAKPLISSLKQISDRVLQERQGKAALLLPLVQSRLTVAETERQIDEIQKRLNDNEDISSTEIMGEVLRKFEGD